MTHRLLAAVLLLSAIATANCAGSVSDTVPMDVRSDGSLPALVDGSAEADVAVIDSATPPDAPTVSDILDTAEADIEETVEDVLIAKDISDAGDAGANDDVDDVQAEDTTEPDVPVIPTPPELCRPCVDDEDCGENAICLEAGPDGRFCATPCDATPCPEDYTCESVERPDGAVELCLPSDGVCPCTEAQTEFTTICYETNDFGTCFGERTCDSDCNAPVPEEESCNGADDDCDGTTDGLVEDCSTVCGAGERRCDEGFWTACTAQEPLRCMDWATCEMADTCGVLCPSAPAETCNGVDDDCDGTTDGMTRACSTECGSGEETCVLGDWVGCTAPQRITCYEYDTCTPFEVCEGDCPAAPEEECNAQDDDCDGVTDGFASPCTSECGEGTQTCISGLWTVCNAPTRQFCMNYETCSSEAVCVHDCPTAPEEECDGVDNDCDGTTDGMLQLCTSACGSGTETCTGGEWVNCTAPPSQPCTDWATCETYAECSANCPPAPDEECDGIDNDCDGVTDGLTQTCETSCGMGTEHCVAGDWVDCDAPRSMLCMNYSTCEEQAACVQSCPPTPEEMCNNQDDDCDGTTDDFTKDCSTDCGDGTNTCIAGDWQGCTAIVPLTCVDWSTCLMHEVCALECPPQPEEQCNGEDDDCDDVADAFSEPCVSPCGPGERRCDDGVWGLCVAPGSTVCTDYSTCEPMLLCEGLCPGPPTEQCDGRDNDCDGSTDEEDAGLCGLGAPPVCDGEVLVETSSPGTCEGGECHFEVLRTLCPWGCSNGACNLCEGSCDGEGTCGDDGCGDYCGLCPNGDAYATAFNVRLATLGRWWNAAANDHATVVSAEEAPGGTFEGQMFFIPSDGEEGTHALHQLLGDAGDHFDSLLEVVTSYEFQYFIGYPWETAGPGMCALQGWVNASTGDHATGFCGEDLSSDGYAEGDLLGYGYPRFAELCDDPLSVEGAEVRLVANRVAGGAISELWWGGRQLLNKRDFGRLLQIRLDLASSPGAARPTEAGDQYGCPPAAWAHGTPLLTSSVSGTTLTTSVHPLQWTPESYAGGTERPVQWTGTFTKAVQLDFEGSPHIIRWETTVALPGGAQFYDLDVVTAALNADLGVLYAYDAFADSLTDLTDDVPTDDCLDPSEEPRLQAVAGTAIAATSDGSYAVGIYRRAPRNNFSLCRMAGDSVDATGDQATRLRAIARTSRGLSPGTYTYTAYVLVGTLDDVRTAARHLYETGR